MKANKQVMLLLVLLISVVYSYAQEDETDDLALTFNGKQNSLNLLSSMTNNPLQETVPFNSSNSVFIQQIGQGNEIASAIKSNNSNVVLNQFGNENYIYLDKNAAQINQLVMQNGNNNSVVDFNLFSNNTINSNFSQLGNNLNIISIGANSISKELTINQTGNSGSVIILNK